MFRERPLPFVARYGWYYGYPCNFEKLEECLSLFVGTHDFRSFCTGYEREDTVRTINAIKVEHLSWLRGYRIIIQGPGFLRYMIRRIVGACILVASTERSIEEISNALSEKNPQQQLFTAPAQGLVLRRIRYKDTQPYKY
jgi:tRNA pseudouridine38-40 synthase